MNIVMARVVGAKFATQIMNDLMCAAKRLPTRALFTMIVVIPTQVFVLLVEYVRFIWTLLIIAQVISRLLGSMLGLLSATIIVDVSVIQYCSG